MPALIFIAIWITFVVGWVMNVYQVIVGLTGLEKFVDISGLMILKLVGIFLAPLGAVLGYFG